MSNNQNHALLIYGCGGHARSVADVALYNDIRQLKFVDMNAKPNESIFGFDVFHELPNAQQNECIVAIGDNHSRAEMFNALCSAGKHVISLIAKDVYLGQDAQIANGVFIGRGAHIGPNVKIGEASILNTRCIIEHDCLVGKYCHISVNAVLAGKSQVGDFVMIGAGAVIIDGVKICSNVTIGAGAVVVKDIHEPGVYVGVPARKIS